MDILVGAGLFGFLLLSLFFVYRRSLGINLAVGLGGLPWAHLRDEVFKTSRSSLRQLTSCSQVLQDG